MKKQSVLTIVFIVLLLQGCIPSLHPFYHKEDLIKDNRLIGTWYGEGESYPGKKTPSIWEFKSTDHDHYHLTYSDSEITANFDANLFVLAGQYYLDIFPSNYDNLNLLQTLTTFPGHLLCKINFEKNGVNIQYIDSDHLETLFKNHQIRLKHERNEEGSTLLTASTQELRQFLIKYGKDDNFFTEADFLSKKITNE